MGDDFSILWSLLRFFFKFCGLHLIKLRLEALQEESETCLPQNNHFSKDYYTSREWVIPVFQADAWSWLSKISKTNPFIDCFGLGFCQSHCGCPSLNFLLNRHWNRIFILLSGVSTPNPSFYVNQYAKKMK